MRRMTRSSLPNDRSFGFTFTVVLVLAGAWLSWKESQYAPAAFGVAALFMLAALALPKVLHPLNAAWMRFGGLLNRIVSPLVMGVIFFALVTPLATVLRMCGRDVLRRRFDLRSDSYWVTRDPPGPDRSSFPRQF